jgi:hypothetical protein
VALHDAVADGKTEAGALPHRLGGEERVEDVRQDLRLDAGAVVAELEHRQVVVDAGRDVAETRTLFCGDLFTQGGKGETPITGSDILGPSEAFRAPMDYYAHAPHTGAILERFAREQPKVLACMHGSAWRGDGATLLRALARALGTKPLAVAA